ncbi:MAG: acetate kinase [Eubacterium sp.]|nr:acetate kinase [Eubacterium sp.]
MKILVINAGSTTLKYQLIDSDSEEVLAKGLCERIGIEGSRIVYNSSKTGEKKEKVFDIPDHGVALQAVIDVLVSPEDGAITSLDEIGAVGHRVVHGGEYFSSSVIVDDQVIKKIEECSDLAPLHNPANLLGIKACQKLMPTTPQCVTFDTAFHQTMPEKAYIYGIPYSYYENYKIRRYGFHGTSHSYVSKVAAKYADKPVEDSKVIVCHIGGGASITAVKGGKSIDTSMGLTPLEGMVMATRSGSIDPAIIQYIADKENKSVDEVLNILNKKSGLQGLSEKSGDMRDINAGVAEGDEKCKVAFNTFVYSAVKLIGSYVASMNGVDVIAFTAGVGENDNLARKAILESFGYLGIKIDDQINDKTHGSEAVISTPDSKVKVVVIPTNEELAIARETLDLIK